jgi:hypothetical protein
MARNMIIPGLMALALASCGGTAMAQPVWFTCSVQGANIPGFCSKLAERLADGLGRPVMTEGTAAEGARMVNVTLTVKSAHAADALLSLGRQQGGTVQEEASQTLQLAVADGLLGASSGSALVYPLVKMLHP